MRPETKRLLIVLAVSFAVMLLVFATNAGASKDEKHVETLQESDSEAVRPPGDLRMEKEETMIAIPTTTTTTVLPEPTTTSTTSPPSPPTTIAVKTNSSGIDWYAIAVCESDIVGAGVPDWDINTGNGYYGGLQFAQSTWDSARPGISNFARADLAPPDEQVAVASTLPLSHWPRCGVHG